MQIFTCNGMKEAKRFRMKRLSFQFIYSGAERLWRF
jgi:hypothetical protein